MKRARRRRYSWSRWRKGGAEPTSLASIVRAVGIGHDSPRLSCGRGMTLLAVSTAFTPKTRPATRGVIYVAQVLLDSRITVFHVVSWAGLPLWRGNTLLPSPVPGCKR
jgi:hypothetical protein